MPQITLKKPLLGFSLIELMISVVIGTIILLGIINVFDISAKLNHTQKGLARIQENGRFALLKLKHDIEQAGFQYCLSSGDEQKDGDIKGTIQRPWNAYTSSAVFPGVTNSKYFDTANLIHGHECGKTSCNPSFTSPGSDLSYTIPKIGTGQGDRLANTDVLTVRYITKPGAEVNEVTNGTTAGQRIINLSDWSSGYFGGEEPNRILLASCNDSPVFVADVITSNANSLTVDVPVGESFSGGALDLTRVFDLDRDVKSITYFVANNIVNGRHIPTLYSVINGVTGALVEGVDRFDVLYGVEKGVAPNTVTSYNTADEIQAMIGDCRPLPDGANALGMINSPGCGWRGVNTIQIHLLINAIQNSSVNNDEKFVYSIDGPNFQSPSDLPSNIDHYNMHRKEFFSVINLKNNPK